MKKYDKIQFLLVKTEKKKIDRVAYVNAPPIKVVAAIVNKYDGINSNVFAITLVH